MGWTNNRMPRRCRLRSCVDCLKQKKPAKLNFQKIVMALETTIPQINALHFRRKDVTRVVVRQFLTIKPTAP